MPYSIDPDSFASAVAQLGVALAPIPVHLVFHSSMLCMVQWLLNTTSSGTAAVIVCSAE